MEQPGIVAPAPTDLAVLLARLDLPPAVSVTQMAGGSNAVYRIVLSDGQCLNLKTYDELRGKVPEREARYAELLFTAGLPVSRYLLVDEHCASLPYRFALTTHLPGVSVASLIGTQELGDVYIQMGRLLRAVHAIKMPSYGGLDELGHQTNGASVEALAAYAFANFREQGGNSALAGRLETWVAENLHLAEECDGPVFAHDDFQPANVLVERADIGAWRVTGLIDFGNARAANAVQDLAKAMFCTEHMAPGSSALLLEGYGTVPHATPAEALRFYTLLHRVIMWMWLRKIGVVARDEHHPLIDDLSAMVS